jgi:outer membrane protein TolC
MKQHILVFLSILFSIGSQAQEAKNSFNLQEAIAHALTHNRQVKNAALSIQAAEKQKWEVTASGLPQISGKIDYLANLDTPFPASDDPDNPFSFFFPKHSIQPNVTLTQLIFDGTYIVALQASKVFLDNSKNAKEKTNNEIKKATISAYSNALLVKENKTIMERNIANLSNSLAETKVIFENGMTEEENIEQLQLTLSGLENDLNNLKKLENISLSYVKLLLGIDAPQKITLTDRLETLILEQNTTNLGNSDTSVFENIDYKIAENNVESKYLLHKAEKFKRLPSIAGFLSGNYQNFTNDRFSSLFDENTKWLSTLSAGVSVSLPIFTSLGGEALIKRTKIEWEIAQNDLQETEAKIALDISKAKSDYELAIDTYQNKQNSLNLSERIERKNEIKFKEGLASSFELRQAQMQLYTAQQEYLQAMVAVINTKATLENLLNIK